MNKSLEDCYKALNIISETCDKINTCKDCPFEKNGECGITKQRHPAFWSIKEPKIKLFN